MKVTVEYSELYKGSKNPPLNTSIILKNKYGEWGFGLAFKGTDKRIYFNFHNEVRGWYGEEKDYFLGWMPFPKKFPKRVKMGSGYSTYWT